MKVILLFIRPTNLIDGLNFKLQDDRRIRLRQFILLRPRRRSQSGNHALSDRDSHLFSQLHAHRANRHHESPGKQITVWDNQLEKAVEKNSCT